jgi:hypothetical protein
MSDDIVAELDRWLDRNPVNDRVLTLAAMVQRARDEIVALRALRKGVADGGWVWEQIEMTHKAARAEALEEARVCAAGFRLAAPHPIGPAFGAGWDTAAQKIAEAIAALKGGI